MQEANNLVDQVSVTIEKHAETRPGESERPARAHSWAAPNAERRQTPGLRCLMASLLERAYLREQFPCIEFGAEQEL